jgi:MFS family permease
VKELIRNRKFTFLWLGQTASGLGGTFSGFIMSWLVYEMTGSLVAMGSIWVTFMLPGLLIQLWSGPYLDRWDRKVVMIFSEWVRAFAFLLPGIMFALGLLEVWHLYVTALIVGIAGPLFRTCSMAYVAGILPKDHLNKGNSLLEGTMQLMVLIGPPLGGLMLQWLGAEVVLFSLVGILGLSGVLLLFIPSSQAKSLKEKESWLKQFVEGIQFYRMNPVLLWVGLLLMVVNFGNGASGPMLLPYVTEVLGGTPFQYGLFTSSFSLGMILASILMSVSKEPKDRRKLMLGALMVSGIFMALLGWVSIFPLAILFVAIKGFCGILFNINNTTLYQRKVPDELRGRVFAVRILLAQAGMPIGALMGGVFAEAWGIPVLFTFVGGIVVLATGAAFLSPVFKHLNEPSTLTVPSSGEKAMT